MQFNFRFEYLRKSKRVEAKFVFPNISDISDRFVEN